MAKPKSTVSPPTPEQIAAAAKTSVIQDLVSLASAFSRAGIHGPFATELPILTSCQVKEKGYRRHNVPIGTIVNAETIRIGARDGLIFVMPIVGEWTCDKGPVDWIELGWDDVVNIFADLSERIEGYLDGVKVPEINAKVKSAIARNKAMHKILSDGFTLAQRDKKENATTDAMQENPLFGQF